MPVYIVTRKTDSEEVTRYAAMSVAEVEKFPLDEFNHIELSEEQIPEKTPVSMSKLTYLRRFTQAERIAIRTAAVASPELQDYLELLTLAEDVRTDDPDIITALGMLEQAGLLSAGRAEEILNG